MFASVLPLSTEISNTESRILGYVFARKAVSVLLPLLRVVAFTIFYFGSMEEWHIYLVFLRICVLFSRGNLPRKLCSKTNYRHPSVTTAV